jgi:hypothetical protein
MKNLQEQRYELKMVAQGTQLPLVRSWIRSHPAGLVTSYPPRRVNNIYLDSPDLKSFEDSLAGISDRRKVRFRWYGDDISAVGGVVEVKRKKNSTGWKVACPMDERFDFSQGMKWADFVAKLSAGLPVRMLAEMGSAWWPVLINRYRRDYYVTAGGEIRVTVDSAQELYDQRRTVYPDLSRKVPYPDTVVVEVKAAAGSWDQIKDLCNNFPISITKNSKYGNGCGALLNN